METERNIAKRRRWDAGVSGERGWEGESWPKLGGAGGGALDGTTASTTVGLTVLF